MQKEVRKKSILSSPSNQIILNTFPR